MSVIRKLRSFLNHHATKHVVKVLDQVAFDIMYIDYNKYPLGYDWERHSVIGWNAAIEFANQEFSNGNGVRILLGDKELLCRVPCSCNL